MGFTVTHSGGTKDAAFQDYARLLRRYGIDLGKALRVPEPDTNRRWLYVWNDQAKAQAFADELKATTADPEWGVVEVNGQVSEGPLGPLVIQIARRRDGLTFGLHTLSRTLIRSAFPGAVGVSYTFIDTATWHEFRKVRGDLTALTQQVVPAITGLTNEQLEGLGYAVIDAGDDATLVFLRPGTLPHAGGGVSADGASGGADASPPSSVGGAGSASPPRA
jgi:hypothetical protein